MNNQREIYEALLAGHTLRYKETMVTVAMGQDGWLTRPGCTNPIPEEFTDAADWRVYEEPKKPRVAEAFVSREGYLMWSVAGTSDNKRRYEESSYYSRAPGFDIAEKSE